MPQDNVHGHIYVDLITEIARRSNLDIDGTGRDALFKFISVAVVAEVEAGGDYFGDRNYYRKRFGEIAGNLEGHVPPNRAASRDDVIAACKKTVDVTRLRFQETKARLGDAFDDSALSTRLCLTFEPARIAPTPPEAVEP